MDPIREYIINEYVSVRVWTDCIETVFSDGSKLVAAPQHDEEYVQRARDLGYGNAIDMNLEHDPLHNIVCCWIGMPHSPTIYGVAVGHPTSPAIRDWEEEVVLDLQRLLNGVHPNLHSRLFSVRDLFGLAAHAKSLLRR